jgi:hypothetical protein
MTYMILHEYELNKPYKEYLYVNPFMLAVGRMVPWVRSMRRTLAKEVFRKKTEVFEA